MTDKRIQDVLDKLDAMGQKNEKAGAKATKEILTAEEEKAKKEEAKFLEDLDSKKKQVTTYKRMLLEDLHSKILNIPWTDSYKWGVWYDGKGVRISIKDKQGAFHQRAFIITYDPYKDLNACKVFALWAEDVFDIMEKHSSLLKTNLIWTPKQKLN